MKDGIDIAYDETLMHNVAQYRMSRFRYLLSTGATYDVLAHQDTSALRAVVLEKASAEAGKTVSIEGVAHIPVDGTVGAGPPGAEPWH